LSKKETPLVRSWEWSKLTRVEVRKRARPAMGEGMGCMMAV
jgi:hypothetical protein